MNFVKDMIGKYLIKLHRQNKFQHSQILVFRVFQQYLKEIQALQLIGYTLPVKASINQHNWLIYYSTVIKPRCWKLSFGCGTWNNKLSLVKLCILFSFGLLFPTYLLAPRFMLIQISHLVSCLNWLLSSGIEWLFWINLSWPPF